MIKESSLEICDNDVLRVRMGRSSNPLMAKAIYIERDSNGHPLVIYVDRLIHEEDQSEIGGWLTSGALSTILRKPSTI